MCQIFRKWPRITAFPPRINMKYKSLVGFNPNLSSNWWLGSFYKVGIILPPSQPFPLLSLLSPIRVCSVVLNELNLLHEPRKLRSSNKCCSHFHLTWSTGGPRISWFLVPKSNHEMWGSWIPRTVFSIKPQNGSKKAHFLSLFFIKFWFFIPIQIVFPSLHS